jgi:hypothetical protein
VASRPNRAFFESAVFVPTQAQLLVMPPPPY